MGDVSFSSNKVELTFGLPKMQKKAAKRANKPRVVLAAASSFTLRYIYIYIVLCVEQVQQRLGYHTDLSMPVHITDHRARTACAWSLHTVAFRVAHHLVRDQTFHAVRAAETNPGTSDRRAARLQLLNHEQSPWRGKSSNAGVSGFSGLHCRAQVGPKRRRHQTLLSSPKARRA